MRAPQVRNAAWRTHRTGVLDVEQKISCGPEVVHASGAAVRIGELQPLLGNCFRGEMDACLHEAHRHRELIEEITNGRLALFQLGEWTIGARFFLEEVSQVAMLDAADEVAQLLLLEGDVFANHHAEFDITCRARHLGLMERFEPIEQSPLHVACFAQDVEPGQFAEQALRVGAFPGIVRIGVVLVFNLAFDERQHLGRALEGDGQRGQQVLRKRLGVEQAGRSFEAYRFPLIG